MRMLLTLLLAAAPSALAHPNAGRTSVVVVMRTADCGVCITQLRALDKAQLGAPLMGITHQGEQAAAKASNTSGVPVYSHAAGIQSMGLWLEEQGMAQPAVVVYDRCGGEAGRIVGRRPGVDVTSQVQKLVEKADAVEGCGKPVS